ncbi:MAG: hypothetical protein ACLFSY_02945 [Desulfonatronovibrionaceae bacterium]
MQKIPISLAQEDMILEKPVMRDNGMVLVGAGTKLTLGLISRLEDMGIERIIVKGEPLDMEGVGSGSSFAKRLERLDHQFRQYEGDEWMQKVKEFIRGYYREKSAAEASSAAEPKNREE